MVNLVSKSFWEFLFWEFEFWEFEFLKSVPGSYRYDWHCNASSHTATHCNNTTATYYCNTLQHTATHILYLCERSCTGVYTATHRNTMQRTAHDLILQHTTATHCNTLLQRTAFIWGAVQMVALHHTTSPYNTLHHTATNCNTLQHTATHCNTLQHIATHCNTLQRTAPHIPHLCGRSCTDAWHTWLAH